MGLLAGEQVKVCPVEGGPTMTIKSIDYWTMQGILEEADATAKVRKTMAAGLVEIEGLDVAAFLAAPAAGAVDKIFHAIWQHSWGNSPAG